MKSYTLFLAFCLFSIVSYAQANENEDGKETVTIDYFTSASSIDPALTNILRNNAIAGVQSMNRVILRDVASKEALKEEAKRRQEASAMGDATARTGEMTTGAANYLIQGQLEAISKSERKDDKGKIHHKCKISYTIKVINSDDATLKATQTYTPESESDTPEKALQSVLQNSYGVMKGIIEQYFKMEGTILQIEEMNKKKDKAKTVIIDLGSNKGIEKYQKFTVYAEKNIAGEIGRKEIGIISAKEILSEKRTLCSVTTGGEEICEESKKENSKLIIISREQTSFGGTSLKDIFSL